jgi:LuxR family transcriptional regulator, maltose regulon positive regulatory protein
MTGLRVAAENDKRPRVRARSRRSPAHRAAPVPFEVVEAKLRVPVLRADTVSRTALVNRLKAAVDGCSIATVAAPAGYGKTTLLAQWAGRDPRPFAWVTVDERDNDPIVLLRHVAVALHGIEPLETAVLDTLKVRGGSIWTSIVPRLGAALSSSEPVVLVLDDCHRLRSRSSLQAVTAIADHLGEGSLLVLAGRAAPRLPIAGLRASGKLFELDAAQLALTPREGQLLLRAAGAELSFAEVIELVRRCEGWPAALYLAAIGFREGDPRTVRNEGLVEFGGSDKHVADYLRSEYLSTLRPAALRFLRRTSVVETMCGALCDAIVQGAGSRRELERIERANLFLISLDRKRVWYRYHHLLRDLLQRELADQEPDLVPVLHRRAADWYEARGDLERALEHADAAGDAHRAARLITAIALPVYYSGRAAAVERWLARFDNPALLRRFPAVALQGSWVHALRGRAADAERWLQIAEAARFKGRLADGSASLRARALALRAALCGSGVHQMLVDAQSALSLLPRDSQARPMALTCLGAAHMLLGEPEAADPIFASAASEAARLGAGEPEVLALSERSLLAAARDDPVAAETFARDADDLVARNQLSGFASTALALTASARASLRHGRWADARAQLAKVEELEPASSPAAFPWLTIQTRLELVRAYVALRDAPAARSLMSEIRNAVRDAPPLGVLVDDARRLTEEVAAMPAPTDGSSVGLTPAELRLLPLLATHLSFREIGEQLYVSRNTIKTQAISVYRKLGVSNRSDAIDRASALGLVDAASPVV